MVAKYQTPSEASQRQTIDEELGIQDVTTIDESWYPPMEVEVASAVESILAKSQPMEVDPAPAEHSYEMFQDDAPELLGMAKGSDSPVTVREDRVLNMPAGFSRARGMADRPPDLRPGLLVVRLRDAQSRTDLYHRHPEEGHRRN